MFHLPRLLHFVRKDGGVGFVILRDEGSELSTTTTVYSSIKILHFVQNDRLKADCCACDDELADGCFLVWELKQGDHLSSGR